MKNNIKSIFLVILFMFSFTTFADNSGKINLDPNKPCTARDSREMQMALIDFGAQLSNLTAKLSSIHVDMENTAREEVRGDRSVLFCRQKMRSESRKIFDLNRNEMATALTNYNLIKSRLEKCHTVGFTDSNGAEGATPSVAN